MKKAIITIALIIFGVSAFAQTSVPIADTRMSNQATTLVLINNTKHKLKADFVYYDKTCNCWVSRGWRFIPKHESNTIGVSELNIGNSIMYVHAEHGFKKWGRTLTFSINESGEPLMYADKMYRRHRRMFSQVNLQSGLNTFEFNRR